MSKYKNIIWDWNGTLLDDIEVCIDCLNYVLDKRSLSRVDRKKYRSLFRFPVADFYKDVGIEFDCNSKEWVDLAFEFIDRYDKALGTMKLHPGAKEMLNFFQDNGYDQFVLSALESESLNEHIDHFGVRRFFKKIYGSDNHFGRTKMDVGMKWRKNETINPKTTLMVGDTHHDYEVAEALGYDCVILSHGHQDDDQLKNIPARKLSCYEELKNYLSF